MQKSVLSISSGSHRTGPNGGDSFPTMTWTAAPGEPAECKDYRDSLTMVPDVWAFPDAVERIDLASVGYEGRIEDEENRSLNQDADLENDSEDSEYEREDDPAAQTSVPWSGTPVDKAPQRLASKVDRDEANASEPAYAYDIQGCDVCGCV